MAQFDRSHTNKMFLLSSVVSEIKRDIGLKTPIIHISRPFYNFFGTRYQQTFKNRLHV